MLRSIFDRLSLLACSAALALALSGCAQTKSEISSKQAKSYSTVLLNKSGAPVEVVTLNVSEGWEKTESPKGSAAFADFARNAPVGNRKDKAMVRVLPKSEKMQKFDDFLAFQTGVMKSFCNKEPVYYISNEMVIVDKRDAKEWSEYCQSSRGGTSEFVNGRVVELRSVFLAIIIVKTMMAFDVNYGISPEALKSWLKDDRPTLDGFRVQSVPVAGADQP